MNIDERLDRLTERHEALTQSIELLTLDIRELVGMMGKLVRVVENHEQRLDDLEA